MIDLNNNFKASKARVYPLFRNKKEEMQKFVNKHLKKGYIRPSKSLSNVAGVLCSKEGRGKMHGYGL